MTRLRAGLFVMFAGVSLTFPGPVAATSATSAAVTYQMTPAHDGHGAGTLGTPLGKAWSVDLGSDVSYPLIAQDSVFVTVRHPASYGTTLHALDLRTGATLWGPVDLPGTYFWSGAAYDGGRLFVVNFDGQLRAFDATAGTLLWSVQLPRQYAFSSPPTAVDGVVYLSGAGTGGTVYAVDETDGTVRWTQPVANGDNSSPAVTADAVYVSYACNHAYGFDRATGTQLWHHTSGCSGGGGKTVAVHDGRVYTRDHTGNLVLDAATGNELRTYAANAIPAFDGTTSFFLASRVLRAETDGGTPLWSFGGDGALTSAPIVDNGLVFTGSGGGKVYALDSVTGELRWTGEAGAAVPAPDEQNVSQPLTGLAAGGGYLVVPAGRLLVAFRNAREPSKLVAEPAVVAVDVDGGNASQFRLSARLTEKESGAAISGRPVVFTAGTKTLCTIRTNAKGVASCKAFADATTVILDQGYTVTFGGDDRYAQSNDRGTLVRALGTGLP